MKHDDIRHKLSEYIDDSVTPKERAEIEGHLASCAECSEALAELRKTIEHVKAIEEVDSPAWMTQKIMARVRAEAEEKRSLLRKLFFPLHVKLSIEAVAMAFLAVTTFYIYQAVKPQMKVAEAPMEDFATKQEAPTVALNKTPKRAQKPVPAPEAKAPAPVTAKDEKRASSLRSEQAPQSQPLTDKSIVRAAPAPSDERFMKEQGDVATVREREAKPFAGLTAQGEAAREAPAPAHEAKAAFAEKKEADIHLTVKVKDIETASKEIEKAVSQLAGKVVKAESLENKKLITVELGPDKANALIEKLKLIGEVEEKTLPSIGYVGNVEVRITILEN